MKQFVILGVIASALFAISSSLSLWLQQTKTPAAEEASEKAAPKKGREPRKDTEDAPPLVRPLPQGGTEDVAKLAASLKEQLTQLKEREQRLDRRQVESEILLQDVRTERDSIDALRKQVSAELKRVLDSMNDLEARSNQFETQKKTVEQERKEALKQFEDVKKKTLELTGSEEKNLTKLATIYDSMPPDSAAKIFQQMSDSGKMDTAAKLLNQMKETKAAKVLTEVQLLDPGLAGQLVDKMRSIKKTPGG